MNEQHIIEILDSRPFAALSENELSQMQAHTAQCEFCRNYFRAVRASAEVLKFESELAPQPSPFFPARVMAALKEKRGLKPVWDFWRVWQASGSLVSLMVVMVAALFFAGKFAPAADTQTLVSADTAEAVIFEQENTLRDITSEQIFHEVYEK